MLFAVAGASCALPAAADPGEPVGMGEYGVERTEHDVAVAVGSKAFAWLTGSAADDELLPLGKSAQFFGFEGLRASSQRAAQRGTLGRAVFALATDAQRDRLARAVVDAAAPLAEWWQLRGEVVAHLRERRFLDEVPPDRAGNLGERWGHANGAVAWVEAAAFAEVERTLTADQWSALRALRADPGRAAVHDAARVTSPRRA